VELEAQQGKDFSGYDAQQEEPSAVEYAPQMAASDLDAGRLVPPERLTSEEGELDQKEQ